MVSILLPRILGPEARGEYQLAVKLAGLVLAVAQWGIPEVLLQVMAEGRARTGALIGTSLGLGLAGAALIAALLGLAAPLFKDNLLRGVDPLLLWLTLGGSVASLVGLLARRFIQLGGRLDVYNGLDVGRNVLFLALVLVGGALLPRQALGPTSAWLIGEIVLAIVATAFLWRRARGSGTWAPQPQLARELARSGAPIQLGLLGMFVGSEGGAFVLNANLDVATVGIYSVALSVSRLVLQVSIALRTALQPRLVAGEQDSAAVTARVTRHGLMWMVAVACALALGSPLAPVVFTREFDAVGPALVLLLPGMVAYGVWQLLAGHLLRIGPARVPGGDGLALRTHLDRVAGAPGPGLRTGRRGGRPEHRVCSGDNRGADRLPPPQRPPAARPGARSRRPGVLRRPDTTCAGASLSGALAAAGGQLPPAVGGVETLLYQTNRLLTDPPLVLAPAPAAANDITVRSVRLDLAARAAYRPLWALHPALHYLQAFSAPALRAAASWRPQAIQAGHIYLAPLAWLLARRLRLPFVVYAYGQEVWRAGRAMGLRPLDALLRGKALRAASTVLVPGGFTAGLLADWRVPRARIVAVPYGAEPRPASAAPSGKTLLTVARLIPRKGIDTVIRAMPGLPADVEYRVVGSGPDERRLRGLAQTTALAVACTSWAGWMNARSPTNIVAAPCSCCRRVVRSTAISRAMAWCTSKPPPGVVPSSPVAPAARSTRSSTARRASW